MHVCVLRVHAPVCVCLPVGSWKLAPGIFQNPSLPYLLSQCLSLNPEITYWLDLLVRRANLYHTSSGVTEMPDMPELYKDAGGGQNLGPHAHTAAIVLTEQSPRSLKES